MSNTFLGNAIGGIIGIMIISLAGKLFNDWKVRVLTKERDNFSYPQIAEDFEYWDGYVNRFLDGEKRLKKPDFEKLSIDQKVAILTENFGAGKR